MPAVLSVKLASHLTPSIPRIASGSTMTLPGIKHLVKMNVQVLVSAYVLLMMAKMRRV